MNSSKPAATQPRTALPAPEPDNSRLTLPAQPVDATPSNALIRQCFRGRSDLFGCPRSKPSQGSVPADLTLACDLAFVFNASRVRLECCVDPLRPPDLSGVRSPLLRCKRIPWTIIRRRADLGRLLLRGLVSIHQKTDHPMTCKI